MGMLISKIAVYVGGMGGISGCRLCAGACAAMECFADIRSFFSFHAIRNGIMRPRSSRPCLPCNPRRSTRERRGSRPLRMHASCMFESHRMHVGGASHLRGACKRALPASVAAPPAGDEWRKQPRVPRAAPLLSKRLRRAHRTIATGRRPRNLRAHALRADAQRRAFAQASRASLLRSCAFTSSPAARFARRRPAFGESAQPAFVGPPI
ncbi:hypothetical protein DO66_200 [Burkholderia pseudomallei]|nr:hypothetical protein DO66_200 [Burkholderia pseudomallei]